MSVHNTYNLILPTQSIICKIVLNGNEYHVKPNEFSQIKHHTYTNLFLVDKLGKFERIISLLQQLSIINDTNLICFNTTHGGFIPINCRDNYNNIYCFTQDSITELCIKNNLNIYKDNKIIINKLSCKNDDGIIFINNDYNDDFIFLNTIPNNYILVCHNTLNNIKKFTNIYSTYYPLKDSNYTVYIPEKYLISFREIFQYYLINNELCYDNLVNLTMIVKNAGDEFEKVLLNNLLHIDSWTILDTGSTDNTINIINKVLVGKKPGKLYQETFVNFCDTRNRCLDLASNDNKNSKFTLMLDDTYIINGNFRDTLNILRDDQYANSYSIYIRSNDMEYVSNRLIKTNSNLRYIYKIHEIISSENNINVCIPISDFYIFDEQSEYMLTRSIDRKQFDLMLLFEMLKEESNNPRHLYYIAQTYMSLEQWETAYIYFMKRIEFVPEGYIQEKIDSYFEAARLCNFRLNKDWEYCKELYLKAYELDSTRPDSLYFIGLHYYFETIKSVELKEYNYEQAYKYLQKAFELGHPINSQYNLKLSMSYYFLPKYLVELCYKYNNYQLGIKACERFFSVIKSDKKSNEKDKDNDYNYMKSWKNIFECLKPLDLLKPVSEMLIPIKPILCFLCDGGFSNWSGSSIAKIGLGGSETFIIEMARNIQSFGKYDVIVFCKCDNDEIVDSVRYIDLNNLFNILPSLEIDTCIISRYTEYLALASKLNIKHIYFSLHDLDPTGSVIPLPKNCHKILCLSNWHINYFTNNFPLFKNITESFGYGIDHSLFNVDDKLKKKHKLKKDSFRFIYSSFANRGLLILLQMWPKIISLYPNSSLDIFVDLNNYWLLNHYKEQVQKIKALLETYPKSMNIINHGWIDKITLYRDYWSKADIWLYPCIFMETFCHTALEAAASKTLIITNDLAALPETVSEYGIIIKGDPNHISWQEEAINILKLYYNEPEQFNINIEQNYKRSLNLSWNKRAEEFNNKYLKNNNL